METNANIRQLLEMLDNPDAYTEQEIRDIINRDEDTRQVYRTIVEVKRSSRHKNHKDINVDAAWQELEQKIQARRPARPFLRFNKIAASFIGIILLSAIAVAAIHIVHNHDKAMTTDKAQSSMPNAQCSTLNGQNPEADTITTTQPVVFDNTALEKMLPEIASHYGATVEFRDDKARRLRFHFVWKSEEQLDRVVQRLNLFESIIVKLDDTKIIVEKP